MYIRNGLQIVFLLLLDTCVASLLPFLPPFTLPPSPPQVECGHHLTVHYDTMLQESEMCSKPAYTPLNLPLILHDVSHLITLMSLSTCVPTCLIVLFQTSVRDSSTEAYLDGPLVEVCWL